MPFFDKKLSGVKLVIASAIFLAAFDNIAFFRNVLRVYPLNSHNLAFLCSLPVVLVALLCFVLALICSRRTIKPALVFMFMLAAGAGYFMDHYNIIIDVDMVQNISQTSFREAADLMSPKLFLYLFSLGFLPSISIIMVPLEPARFKTELLGRLRLMTFSLLLVVAPILLLSRFYAPFFREHKELRYYTNPVTLIYSVTKFTVRQLNSRPVLIRTIGDDANIPETDADRELVILVVGEAARADHFSLNGYQRETNPLLKKEKIINFSDMHSCGTSTAVSVPCMFSIFDHDEYSDSNGRDTQNILDVLSRSGVHILWRDNNSDSKGVAERVRYEDFQSPAVNPVCDVECRDEGMLSGLQEYIDGLDKGDILIVLHQMGNHGPAYFKRYPQAFEKFIPVCRTSELDECSTDEIINAYDNAILYTDYFLSKVIDLLKNNSGSFETAMIYLSDHGESLGEGGLYLHGLPYFMAPEAQTHIGSVMWFGEDFKLDLSDLGGKATQPYSQDNLFHTLLGIMEVNTAVYIPEQDIIN